MDAETLSVSDSQIMVNQKQFAVLSAAHTVGSIGWRHELTWRQLSTLWNLPISQIGDCLVSKLEDFAGLSVVLEKDADVYNINKSHLGDLAKVLFLDRLRIATEPSRHLKAERCENYSNPDEFCHVFRIGGNHPLTQGLPHRVTIYGRSPIVTPLAVNHSSDVLLTLNDIPVIAAQSRDLLVGVDPWQLGAPCCPMLYKILSNWLVQVAGIQHSIAKPYAIIRLDDLPTTAEEAKRETPNAALDKRRSRVLKRLRKFAEHESIKFTLMYSSHLTEGDGPPSKISSIMVKSIDEMRNGVRRGVFEIGSHGMIHLRGIPSDNALSDPREFLDLDERQTRMHLSESDAEISRLFLAKPESFVAPAWGYRPGVTKRVARELYSVIADSSQHMEDGTCDILMGRSTEGKYFNATETFRVSERVLTYSDWRFWRCYATAGIPVHYMQHTDHNWQVLRALLRVVPSSHKNHLLAGFRATLQTIADDAKQSTLNRAISVWLLVCFFMLVNPASSKILWRSLTANSIYCFIRAMKKAGYAFQTLTEFSKSEQYRKQCQSIRDLSLPIPST